MSDLEMGPITWVMNEEELGHLYAAIETAEEVVWDLETTGLVGTAVEGGKANGGVGARQVLATYTLPQRDVFGQWDGVDPTTWVLPLSHPDSPWAGQWRATTRGVMQHIRRLRKPLSGHNLKFDLRYHFQTTGTLLTTIFSWDTMDATRLLEQGLSAKLGDAAPRAFPGLESWKDFDFSTPGAAETYPLFELGEYGARDTYWSWRLKRYQQNRMFLTPDSHEPMGSDEIQDARLGKLATWIAMPTVASLAQIEINGMMLDTELTEKELLESTIQKTEALMQMGQRYSVDFEAGLVDLDPEHASAAPTSHWFRRFMEHAVSRRDAKVMELTKAGKTSWSKSALKKQARALGEDSVPALVLHQRHHQKRTEFLTSWLNHVTPAGFVHASYNTGMATGRLSSSEPNMQQVTKLLRPMYCPRPGYVIADFDFSQIELRIAAFISRSAPMLEAFARGDDLHRLLAAEVTGLAPEEVTDDERQMAKAVNFGLLFGLGAFGLQGYAENSYGVTMTKDQAQEFYHAYFRKWDGLKQWHAKIEAELMRDSAVVSPLGRVRNFGRGGFDGKDALNAAINAPVQGMASDLMQIALADIQGLLPASAGRGAIEDILVVGTVHDSGIVELPEDNWEEKAYQIKERLEDLNPLLKHMYVELDVPIKIEATIGTRWSLKDVGEVA